MSDPEVPHIAIIGGGFSGTMAAVNLARLSERPLRVTLVNAGYPAGRGIAYSAGRPEHLLNVVARNLSALPDHPHHFIDWLRTRSEYAGVPEAELREAFLPRRLYGDYLRSLLMARLRPIDGRALVRVELLETEAVNLEPEGGQVRIILADGGLLTAHKVLLATGNEPPAGIPGSDSVAGHPGWCANPWVDWAGRLPPPGADIVLLGAGLTAIDAFLTLRALGWRGSIQTVSRHGLFPHSHFKGVDDPAFPPADVDLSALGLAALVRLLEEHCERLRRRGLNPAIVVDKLRPHTQRIWRAFTERERREFVERHAARWNVLRHRIAPSIHRQVEAALAGGELKVISAGVLGVEGRGPRIGLKLRAADGTVSVREAALVINCTGPHTRFSATGSPLLRNVLARGLARPDAMDMGIEVGPDFAVVHGTGYRSRYLFAIGPLLRGTLWESVAVPELRGQALRVAQALLDEVPPVGKPAGAWPVPAEADVIEYLI